MLVASIGLLALVIVLNNLTDYNANFRYIQHVLSMDTVFEDSQLIWRAVTSLGLQRAAYGAIIGVETAIAALCLTGALRLLKVVNCDRVIFNRAKATAIYGLTLAFLFWFVGFMVVAGEWFTMWQSLEWNGQQPAFRSLAAWGLC